MKRSQTNRFTKALEAKRDELKREIRDRRERLAVDPANDPMDKVRGFAERDVAVRNMDHLYGMLRMVEGALRELREGTFGVCARCGNEIPAKRLEAVPWSPYCVSCQERVEQSPDGPQVSAGRPSVTTRYALAG